MDLTRTSQDLTIAFRGIQMLDFFSKDVMYRTQANDIFDFLGRQAGFQDFTYPGTDQKFRLWFTPDSTVILALGATTFSSVQDLVTGYILGPDGNNPQGFNASAQIIARYLFANAIGGVFSGPKRMFFFGHSFGGVVLLALSNLVAAQAGPPNISVVTYGCPRAGNRNAQIAIGNVDSWRWLATGDRVQYMPPTPSEAPLANSVMGLDASTTCQQFGHLTNATLLQNDSNQSTVLTENLTSVFTDISLVNFAINNEAPTSIAHSISNYLILLRGAYNAAVDALLPAALPIPGPVMGPRIPPPMPNNPVEVPGLLGGAVFNNPPNPNYNNSVLPYYHEKDNGQWWVKSDGLGFAVCKTAKQARALARALNTSWRKWNGSLLASSTAFDFTVAENFLD